MNQESPGFSQGSVNPQPGDFGLTRIPGYAGFAARIGIFLNGDGWHRYQHAFLVLEGDQLIEAMPGGARIRSLIDPDIANATFSDWSLTDDQRAAICTYARTLVDTPYSILDYLSLTLVRLHIRPPGLTRYIADSGHMICSQLIDHVYLKAGLHMFNDGRFSGDVTPGDLRKVLHGPA
jgi:uncharacterized protein YycO